MSTPENVQSEILRHRDLNSRRLAQLMKEQVNMEATRPLFLRFTAVEYDDGLNLSRMLFAKGMRLLTQNPTECEEGWSVEVAAKHNLREITQESFVCDLITLANNAHARYDCWDFLSGATAEGTQQYNEMPESKSHNE